MELTIYAKKRQTLDGKKTFFNYLTTLTKKDGSELKCAVKFRESCGNPKPEECPKNILVDKKDANLTHKELTLETGEVYTVYTLWVSAWKPGKAYVDHSLDDFD